MAGEMSSTRFREHPVMGSYGGLVCDEKTQKPFFCFSIGVRFPYHSEWCCQGESEACLDITSQCGTLVAAIAAFETTDTLFGAVIKRICSEMGSPCCLAN